MTNAVCYIASDGYLFQTVVSAVQARHHVDAPIFVEHLGDPTTAEAVLFRSLCEEEGVTFHSTPLAILSGLHPVFARFFLDEFIPAGSGDVLYVDGDTQVVGSLNALMNHAPGAVVAARDPMVLIEKIHPRIRRTIHGWWDTAQIPPGGRGNYVNAGVIRLPLERVPEIRRLVLEMVGSGRDLPFKDQDAINLLLGDEIHRVSSDYNFPGFLLGTDLERSGSPRIIHFMSSPRPWNAALAPWGERYFAPYGDFVRRHPASAPYWDRFSSRQMLRYRAQYAYKFLTERIVYSSSASLREYRALEASTTDLHHS